MPLKQYAHGLACKAGCTDKALPEYKADKPERRRVVSVTRTKIKDITGKRHTQTHVAYEREEYDRDAALLIRNRKGLSSLIATIVPTASGERKQRMIEMLQSMSHAKQRQLEHRARRLTKAERRALKRKRT